MKTITIIGAEKIEVKQSIHTLSRDAIVEGSESMSVFDSYHTMEELYEHRLVLFIALCKLLAQVSTTFMPKGFEILNPVSVWRSKLHSDGSSFDGWFILGIGKEAGKQITYYLPYSKWEDTEFAETLEKAPEFDGHTFSDVLKRIANL